MNWHLIQFLQRMQVLVKYVRWCLIQNVWATNWDVIDKGAQMKAQNAEQIEMWLINAPVQLCRRHAICADLVYPTVAFVGGYLVAPFWAVHFYSSVCLWGISLQGNPGITCLWWDPLPTVSAKGSCVGILLIVFAPVNGLDNGRVVRSLALAWILAFWPPTGPLYMVLILSASWTAPSGPGHSSETVEVSPNGPGSTVWSSTSER